MKNSIMMVMAGVGGTLLYQNIKNGNMKKLVAKINKAKDKAVEEIEDMM